MRSVVKLLLMVGVLYTLQGTANLEGYVTLRSSKEHVLEYSNCTLACSYFEFQEVVNTSHWKYDASPTWFIGRQGSKCSGLDPLNNEKMYHVYCLPNDTFFLTILNVTRQIHGKNWKCGTLDFAQKSNSVAINVTVPVADVTLTGSNVISENSVTTFTCTTSYSIPPAQISWFKSKNGNGNMSIVNSTSANITHKENKNGKLTQVIETLQYTANRSINSWSIYCNAGNWMNNKVESEPLMLNVTYPPDQPPVIHVDGFLNLNGSTYDIMENRTGNISCSVTGGNPLSEISWIFSDGKQSEMMKKMSTVTRYLTWIASRNQEKKYTCRSNHLRSYTEVFVHINVTYPPGPPNMKISYHSNEFSIATNVAVHENSTFNLTCEADSNPRSSISWNLPSRSTPYELSVIQIINVQRNKAGAYICKADNNLVPGLERSTTVNIDVLYAPEVSNMANVSIVEGSDFTKSCSVTPGNPEATVYQWTNDVDDRHLNQQFLSIKPIQRSDSRIYTCTANNTIQPTHQTALNGSSKKSFTLNVLYPPDTPTVHISESGGEMRNVIQAARVIENLTYILQCSAVGNPIPTNISWQAPSYTQSSATLAITNITKDQKGIYTCTAENIMVPTSGSSSQGRNTTSVQLDVMYQPDIGELKDRDVDEGEPLNITCPVIAGNPSGTNVRWTRTKDNESYIGKVWQLQHVSRKDDMVYICTTSNFMIPTVGSNKTGKSSKSFHLNVLYQASIKTFYVHGSTNVSTGVIHESKIQFICKIDSNPGSFVTIQLPNGIAVNKSHTRHFEYNHTVTSCLDIGKYTCSADNGKNKGQPAMKHLDLLVKCKPMSGSAVDTSVRSELYVPATLTFTTLAYPPPSFEWEVLRNTTWVHIKGNSSFTISHSTLTTNHTFQYNLTINNFTEKSEQLYRLRVNNTEGEYLQQFSLLPNDKPAAPTHFSHIVLTENSVTLEWAPGFNGGIPQNFTIFYKAGHETEWISVTIDDTGADVMSYEVDGLASDTRYVFNLFAFNRLGNSTTTLQLSVATKAPIKSEPSAVGMVAGSISGVIVVVVGAVLAILFYKRRFLLSHEKENETGKLIYQNVPATGKNQKKKMSTKTHIKKESSFHELQELDDTPTVYREATEYCNSIEQVEQMTSIKVSELLAYVSGRSEDDFSIDFQKLPSGLQKPCTFARKPENIAMNRYNGIYPYDDTRVTISGEPDFFINACYIHGYKKQNAYIASLGPVAALTLEFKTFWMMVWHEHSDVIAMLTNLHEPSGMKCEQYWPKLGKSMDCGDIHITCDKEQVYAEYTMRSLTITKAGERRNITHLHYTAWPDKKVPEDVATLIDFREKLRATVSSKTGPVIVHCSAGIGRTGTLIALDRLIEEGHCELSVDVFKCVNDMREQRVKMVQTQEQYIYIFKALVHSLYFDCEMIPAESFQEYVEQTNNNIYSKQFQQLKESAETGKNEAARSGNEMTMKMNRHGADIPDSHYRVFLHFNRKAGGTDYINAVYINSFKKRDHFITAQSPLPDAVIDFVCMLYQEECCCVVSMEDLKDPGMRVGQYLPSDGQALHFGDIKVSCTNLETKPEYTVREMRMKNNGKFESGEKVAYHFQYHKWAKGNDTPADAKEFVQFIKDVEEYAEQLGDVKSHVLVHCLKANERSALYCIVAILMDKMRYEGQVSVLNTIRHLRTRRRTAITSMEQLKFCYQAVSAHISMSEA